MMDSRQAAEMLQLLRVVVSQLIVLVIEVTILIMLGMK